MRQKLNGRSLGCAVNPAFKGLRQGNCLKPTQVRNHLLCLCGLCLRGYGFTFMGTAVRRRDRRRRRGCKGRLRQLLLRLPRLFFTLGHPQPPLVHSPGEQLKEVLQEVGQVAAVLLAEDVGHRLVVAIALAGDQGGEAYIAEEGVSGAEQNHAGEHTPQALIPFRERAQDDHVRLCNSGLDQRMNLRGSEECGEFTHTVRNRPGGRKAELLSVRWGIIDGFRRAVVLTAFIHAVCQDGNQLPQEACLYGAVQVCARIAASHAVVGNQLFFNVSGRLAASEKIHRRLYGHLGAFDIAGEEDLFQRGNRRRFRVRVIIRVVFIQGLDDLLTCGDHLVRGHVPIGRSLVAVQRQHCAFGPSLVQQFLPQCVRLYAERYAGDHVAF